MSKIRFMMGLVTVTILAPQIALAATPQQMLDRAVRLAIEQSMAQTTTLEMNGKGTYTPLRTLSKKLALESGAKITPSSFHVQVIFEGDSFPRGQAVLPDGQGRIRLVKLTSTGDPAIDFTNLGSFEWKTIGKVFYLRLAEISPLIREYLTSAGSQMTEVDKVVGVWLKVDPNALTSFLQESLPSDAGASNLAGTPIDDWQSISRMSPLMQVLRVEKKVTQGSETYTRLAVRIHPMFWTRLEREMIKLIDKDLLPLKTSSPREYARSRAQRHRDLRASLLATRLQVNKVRLVVMINDRSGRIERVEGAMQQRIPSHAYLYRETRTVKVLEGHHVLNFQFVGTMRDIQDQPVLEPAPVVTLQELVQRLMDTRTESMAPAMP